MSDKPLIILLIEDSPQDSQLFMEALGHQFHVPYRLELAARLSSGLEFLKREAVDLVLLDLMLPDSQGLDSITRVHREAPDVPIVVLTASDDEVLATEALQKGAHDYLVKGYVQVYPNLLGRAVRYTLERKRAAEQLRAAYEQTEQLLSSLPSILIGVNAAGLVTHWNSVAEATFGIAASDAIRRPFTECGVQWKTSQLTASIEGFRRAPTSPVRVDDVTFKRPDGRDGFLGITLVPMRETTAEESGFLLFGADVTERKQAESERLHLQEELDQAQKMETIGRFAGGIAHDFNNFLQVILGFAWLIRSRRRDDRELSGDLQEIVHAAESASSMVRQLLAFSRRQPIEPKVFDINQAVQNMSRLLQQFLGDRIRLDPHLAATPLMVKLDPTGLEQILMNLCANGRDSMPQGGVLTVSTRRVIVDAASMENWSWKVRPGAYVQLSVQDTGMGMDPSVASHIFEPFFTTKQVGKGTGLGLAVVYGLVKQHEGMLDVQTAPGQGTTFQIFLPHQEPAAEEARFIASDASGRRRGHEAVFVIGPDSRQQQLDAEVLREAGYQVAGVMSGAQALERLTQKPEEADAALLDSNALASSGWDLLARLREARPYIRVLLVSEAVDEQMRLLETSLSGVVVLARPYEPARLLEQLRLLLNRPRTTEPSGVAASAPETPPVRGSVLVVDDDPAIRLLCDRILSPVHAVTIVSSSREALAVLPAQPIDLLLTDLMMPDMDGFALIQEVLRRYPRLKILVMSGSLTAEMSTRLLAVSLSTGVIHKPFTAQTLLEMVSRRLTGAG